MRNSRVGEWVLNTVVGSIAAGVLTFSLIDIVFYHHFSLFQDLFYIFLTTTIVGVSIAIVQLRKNRYMRLTFRKLLSAEQDTGISAYVASYLGEIEESSFFSIAESYSKLEDHLRRDYYLSIPLKDFTRALESIFKSGDLYYVSLASLPQIVEHAILAAFRNSRVRLIVPDEIVSGPQHFAFIQGLRCYARVSELFWRRGHPLHVFNIILSLREDKRNKNVPVRALKFEAGENSSVKSMHMITDLKAMKFWQEYFIRDWEILDGNLRRPLCDFLGTAQVVNAVVDICDNYSDLFSWMKEAIEQNSDKRVVTMAVDRLKGAGRYDEKRCTTRSCQLCKQ